MPANKNRNNKPDCTQSTSAVLIKNMCSRKVLDMLDQKILEMEKEEKHREKNESRPKDKKVKGARATRSAPTRSTSQPPRGRRRPPIKGILRKTDLPDNTNNAHVKDGFYTYTSPAPSRQNACQDISSSSVRSYLQQSLPQAWDVLGGRSAQKVRFQGAPCGLQGYPDCRDPFNWDPYGDLYKPDPSRDVTSGRGRSGGRHPVSTKYGDAYQSNPVTFSKNPRDVAFERNYRSNVNANRRQEPGRPAHGRPANGRPAHNKTAKNRSSSQRPTTECGDSVRQSWRDVTCDTQDMIARYDAMFERDRLATVGKPGTWGGGCGDCQDASVSGGYSACHADPAAIRGDNKYTAPLSDTGFDYKASYEKLDRLISGPQTLEALIHKYTNSYTNSYTPWRRDFSLSGGYGTSGYMSAALKREFSSHGYPGVGGSVGGAYAPAYNSCFSKSSSSLLSQDCQSHSSVHAEGKDTASSWRTPYVAASPVVTATTVGTNNSNITSGTHSLLRDNDTLARSRVSDVTPDMDTFRESAVDAGSEHRSFGYTSDVGRYQSKFMADLMKDAPSRSSSSSSTTKRKSYAELMATYKVSSPEPSPPTTSSPCAAHESEDDIMTSSVAEDDDDDEDGDSTLVDDDDYEEGMTWSQDLSDDEESDEEENRCETYTFLGKKGADADDTLSHATDVKGHASDSIHHSKDVKIYNDQVKGHGTYIRGHDTIGPPNESCKKHDDVTSLAQDLIDLANGNTRSVTENNKSYNSNTWGSHDESESFRPAKKASYAKMGETEKDRPQSKMADDAAKTSRVKHIDSLLDNLSSWKM